MVHGLSVFRDFFVGYEEQYILIGGSACDIAMEAQAETFRATKDLDLVISSEALTKEFVARFWEFIRLGEYSYNRKSDGKRTFYRFEKPLKPEYPAMLEILSREESLLQLSESNSIIRMHVEEEIVSLSAILLNEDYYNFIREKKIIIEGISIADLDCLIPLKIRAWLDLKDKKKEDPSIRSREVNKHRNDVLRLEPALAQKSIGKVPEIIREDLKKFDEEIRSEEDILIKLGIKDRTLDSILNHFNSVYSYIE